MCSVAVPMVEIGQVRVGMLDRFVPMAMRMARRDIGVVAVFMGVVSVVMDMLVFGLMAT